MPRLRCLVVLPTRDLAAQVFRVFAGLCPAVGLRVALAAAQASVAAEAAEAFGGHLEAPCPGMHICSDNHTLSHFWSTVSADDAVLGWEGCRTSPAVDEVHAAAAGMEGLAGPRDTPVDILVATPGRLMAHLRGTPGASLEHLRYLVRVLHTSLFSTCSQTR